MATNTTCICAHASLPGWAQHHLDHTQQHEELIVEQYTQVLEALEDQHLRIGQLLVDVEKESFEEIALGKLLSSIREAMRQNEVGLTETRRDLWKRYWEEDDIAVAVDVNERCDAVGETKAVDMSGIPVYTSSPVKASGTSPQTAVPGPRGQPLAPTPTSASATSTASASSSYDSPTSAAQQRYVPLPLPLQSTPTSRTDSAPPAPQPGAFPTPLSRTAVPPPPKAGESFHPRQTGAPTYPPQMSYGPPTATYGSLPLGSSTSTTNAPSMPYPVAIPTAEGGPRRSLEHPPGYHQNVYASELTSDQRRAQETEQANHSSGLALMNQDKGSAGGFGSEGMWDTAKKWAQTAGEKLSVAEAEVWKKINKD